MKWLEAIHKELAAFLKKEGWSEATPEDVRLMKQKGERPVPCTSVYVEKPISASTQQETQSTSRYKQKARFCMMGNRYGGFSDDVSTTNADAHLVRLFLSCVSSPGFVMGTLDVSNAFLNVSLKGLAHILAS